MFLGQFWRKPTQEGLSWPLAEFHHLISQHAELWRGCEAVMCLPRDSSLKQTSSGSWIPGVGSAHRVTLVPEGWEVTSVASGGLWIGTAASNPMCPARPTWAEHEEAAAITQAGRMSALMLGGASGNWPSLLLTGQFSSSFMITKDNQSSWKPAIFVPFTLFGPQAPKTLSQCPRGPLPFRENV